MTEKIERFLKDFLSAWQVAKIYEVNHPLFSAAVDKAYSGLKKILAQKEDLVVGIFEDELASGEDIFFELSKKAIISITYLKNIGIERIVFHSPTTKDELTKLISFFTTPKDEVKDQPQEYLQHLGIKNIEVGKIKGTTSGPATKGTISPQEKAQLSHYHNCLRKLSQSMVNLVEDDAVDSFSLKFVSGNIMENLLGNYQMFSELIKTKSHDTLTFVHVLNVSILAIYFAHKLGFAKEDCLDIGIAALFHDIGKIYISRKIIQKPGKLDEAEFDAIKSHTVLGAEILLKHIDTLTILPVVVAFEHHLKYDLSGYPEVAFPRKLHIASLIVSICDEYDALTQRRSYKRDYPSELIYKIMTSEKGTKFEPQLLDKFFKFMGVWSQGTIVELEDKRIAIVREINEDDIFSPRIEVISNTTREFINLKETKSIKIKRSLNPLNEGKQYLGFL